MMDSARLTGNKRYTARTVQSGFWRKKFETILVLQVEEDWSWTEVCHHGSGMDRLHEGTRWRDATIEDLTRMESDDIKIIK